MYNCFPFSSSSRERNLQTMATGRMTLVAMETVVIAMVAMIQGADLLQCWQCPPEEAFCFDPFKEDRTHYCNGIACFKRPESADPNSTEYGVNGTLY